MKIIAIALFLALPTISYADRLNPQYIYKCVKNGKTTIQEMPCGWDSTGGHGPSDKSEQNGSVQYFVPMEEFCNDKTVPEQSSLKRPCYQFRLPKDSK
jgi:hypothetical protein